jgi:hypothetical protein
MQARIWNALRFNQNLSDVRVKLVPRAPTAWRRDSDAIVDSSGDVTRCQESHHEAHPLQRWSGGHLALFLKAEVQTLKTFWVPRKGFQNTTSPTTHNNAPN